LAAIASFAVCCLCGVAMTTGAVLWLSFWLLLFEGLTAADWVAFVDFFMVLLLVLEWLCCVC
jgi:hypothetical protein